MLRHAAAPWRIALAGALACLVAQGLGRFLLTPLLPAMQAASGIGDATAGLLASANFAGYLAGASLMALRPPPEGLAARLGLLLVVAGGAAMAGPVALWLPARAAAGFGGALLFLAGVSAAARGLAGTGRPALIGVVFAGVGAGIAASGLVALACLPAWRTAWLAFSLAAACAWPLLGGKHAPARGTAAGAGALRGSRPLWCLAGAYACGGLAFAAAATFFVSTFATGDPVRAVLAWTVAGLAAAPSTLLWVRLGTRIGSRAALALATLLLALGTGLGALDSTPRTALLSGLLVGGTFVGVTALSMGRARELAPAAATQAAGLVTVAFGIGQVLGPALSGHLLATAGVAPALLTPAGIAILGVILLLAGGDASPSSSALADPPAGS